MHRLPNPMMIAARARVRFCANSRNPLTTMNPLLITVIALAAIAAILFFFFVGTYNRLVALRNRFKNAFAQIDVQLKRRYDLIPNLVETAKGYLKHERETLEAVIKARNIALGAAQTAAANPADAGAMKNLLGAESGLGGALSRLMVVVEQYPDLKASQNMMQLTEELTSTESKISFARQSYNDAVMAYNTQREVFPSNLVAGPFNFTAAELFVIEDAAQREATKVSFT
jgi:LemA protein